MYGFRSVSVVVVVFNLIMRRVVTFPYQVIGSDANSTFVTVMSKSISFSPTDSMAAASSSMDVKPTHLADQTMEPSSMEEVYYIQPRGHRRRNQFNPLNFDAYMVKPTNFSYKRVLATLKPETERILKLMNRTIGMDEQNRSGSKSRSGKGDKRTKSKKFNMFGNIEESSPVLVARYNRHSHTKETSKLPIGLAYFEAINKKYLSREPTYSPLPIMYPFRRSMDRMKSSGHQTRAHIGEVEQTGMHSMQNHIQLAPSERTHQISEIDEAESKPEMFKFTLEDAMGKSHDGVDGTNTFYSLYSTEGPVTTGSTAVQTNKVIEEYVNPRTYKMLDDPLDAEPQAYTERFEILSRAPTRVYQHRRIMTPGANFSYRIFDRQRYHRPTAFRELKPPTPSPTEEAVTEESYATNEPIMSTKSPGTFKFFSWDPSQLIVQALKVAKGNKFRKQPDADSEAKETMEIKRKSRQNMLEVSSSYSKQRTQGMAT